jgi:molybdopterin-guanine dinucleotide biosynthesis protein A
MQLSAVILAGGQSSRMGRDKAWVEYRDKPLIQLAFEKIGETGISEIFISGRTGENYSGLKARVLIDIAPGIGPIGGIERALWESISPLVLVVPVDLPHLSAAFLQKLILRCTDSTGALPRLKGALEPLVAVYPKRCHPYACFNIARSQYAVCDFANACLHERAVRTFNVHAKDARCFANCNSPSDLADLESL